MSMGTYFSVEDLAAALLDGLPEAAHQLVARRVLVADGVRRLVAELLDHVLAEQVPLHANMPAGMNDRLFPVLRLSVGWPKIEIEGMPPPSLPR